MRRSVAILLGALVGCAAGEQVTEEDARAADEADAAGSALDADVALDDVAATGDAVPDATDREGSSEAEAGGDAGPDATDADAAVDASPDAMDASIPPDAGPLGDGLPVDAVMYFTGTACPRGWAPYTDGVGRVAMPTVSAALVGVQRGTPLGDAEDRVHEHTVAGSFAVPAVTYAGIAGCCNDGLGAAATLPFRATAQAASAGLPYVQLLVCRKAAPPRVALLPAGMMVFFAAGRCPTGFSRPKEPGGHLPVGLPAGGLAGARFGATPPGAGEARSHRHDVAPELTTAARGIALAGGCCAGGYAANGTYRGAWTSSESESGPPTVQLLLCQKD